VLAAISSVMLLVWFAGDPDAHEHFPHDSGKCDHQCVVKEFANGSGYYIAPAAAVSPEEAAIGPVRYSADERIRKTVECVLRPKAA
jgi:hypothetical protein